MDFYKNIHKSLLKDFNFDYSLDNMLIIDLVTLMGAVYCEDVSVPAKQNNQARSIELAVPVFHLEKWNSLTEHVNDLVSWVSQDDFKVSFVQRNKENVFSTELQLSNGNDVTLFSGGLDSLSGAYYNFLNKIESDYIGFINKDEEHTHQKLISDFYKSQFKDSTEIILVGKPLSKKTNYTQSTRSLLYLALAAAKAYFNGSSNVYLYENGILSLNPELNNRFTTKTTHPKTIYLYNELLRYLSFKLTIKHPFMFSTKGEIINNMNEDFKNAIKDTFTCGQGRANPKRNHKHQCGICVPCLLRKISLSAYDNEDYDSEYEYPYKVKFKDIQEDEYRKDYISNIDYFKSYYTAIIEKKINVEIHTRPKYYEGNSNYRLQNHSMFMKFAEEYERFMEKYAPY